ncbi:MAG: aminotransferase class V-fold PLP-dependent enzyme, partial [Raoultibacter sp.]
QGIGALLMTPAFAQALKPLIVGGTGSASDSEQQPTIMPDRFEAGTLNLPGIFGMHAALSFVEQQTITALRKHEQQLCEHFIDGLRAIDNLEKASRVRIAGPLNSEQRVGVFSLDFIGRDNAEATFLLEQDYGILTRCGLHCSPSAHKTLGTFPQGSVRFSFGYTTTLNDIDTALAAIEQIAL